MIRILALVALGGCVSIYEGGDWEPIETITGELAPEIGPAPTQRAQLGDTLRVVTWNVHFGEDAAGIAEAMRASDHVASADVLLVQEIEAYPDESNTRTQRLADLLGMTWVYAPARKDDGHTHGIAMLSRLPLENVAIRELPYVEQPFRSRNRIAMAADIQFNDRLVRIVNVHLDVRIGPVDRVHQLHGAVNEVGDGPIIVGGDFNTNPWAWVESSVPLLATEAIVGQEQAAVVDDYLSGIGFAGAIPVETPTMRLPAFQMRTDDLYARDLRIVDAGVEYVDGSDHWPVWFDVAID